MKKALVLSAAAIASLLSLNASAIDIMARVISSTPVVQQVAVPRQVCNNQAIVTEAPKSGGGALLGAVAGGAVGNAIGNGGGRALATMIGLVGGAIVGDRIEGSNGQLQNVQQCSTQTFYENRASVYNVVYEYQGTQYNTQMATDPGPYVRLQVTPVGAVNQLPQGAQPHSLQQSPVQSGYIQSSTSYVQPVYSGPTYQSAPVYQGAPIYQAAPIYYPQSYYPQPYYPQAYYSPSYYPQPYFARPYYARPYYAPVGVSLNFGYGRGYGGHHWR